jgi:DNA-binding MarR family transcriptional regulator
MKIFLSHSTDEKDLALAIKEWIESAFPGTCSVFVSSDLKDIPHGAPWKVRIHEAMDGAGLVIVLASLESLKRRWVNIEAGFGWGKSLDLLCLCHGGQTAGSLPHPFSDFQGLDIDDPQFGPKLVGSIATRLKVNAPRIDFDSIRKAIDSAVSRIVTEPSPRTERTASPSAEAQSQVSDEELEILKILANSDYAIHLDNLVARLQMHPQKVKVYLERLEERELIYRQMFVMEPSVYSLTREGRELLFRLGLLG